MERHRAIGRLLSCRETPIDFLLLLFPIPPRLRWAQTVMGPGETYFPK